MGQSGNSSNRRSVNSRRRDVAVVAALLVHVAFFMIIFLPLNQMTDQRPAGEDGGAVTVTLVRGAGLQTSTAASQAAELDKLGRRLRLDTPSPLSTSQNSQSKSGASLLNLFGPQQGSSAESSPTPARDGHPSSGANGRTAQVVDPGALASMLTPEDADRTVIWPQVARCWRGHKSAEVVAMLVRLDAGGGIQGQPTVFRRSPESDPARLDAEREATRALWDCAPYRLARGDPSVFKLLFQSNGK